MALTVPTRSMSEVPTKWDTSSWSDMTDAPPGETGWVVVRLLWPVLDFPTRPHGAVACSDLPRRRLEDGHWEHLGVACWIRSWRPGSRTP